MQTSRRNFLKTAFSSTALVALAPTVPQFLFSASARAAAAGGENILVVVQLTGGNDGLNTVIPYADDAYRKNRPSLAVGSGQVRKVADGIGLHPSMEGFSKLLEAGQLGVMQGVGYPNPDRSHFSSMDIWHSARRDVTGGKDGAFGSTAGHRASGWIGRYLDAQAKTAKSGKSASDDVPALHLTGGSTKLPLALVGDDARATSVGSLDGFKLEDGGDDRIRKAVQRATDASRPGGGDDLITFLQHNAQSALRSSREVQDSLKKYQTDVQYPDSGLAKRLKTVAQLIDAGMGTRIYYLDLDGFDTHSNQAAAHAALLGELSGAVTAFVQDLDKHGHGKRVLAMTFSEFGRRLHENASQGTDHGAAAPMFFAGGKVKSGLLGKYPSLSDLDEGDLKHTTDFRGVYAGVLEHWLGVSAKPILGEEFAPVKVTT